MLRLVGFEPERVLQGHHGVVSASCLTERNGKLVAERRRVAVPSHGALELGYGHLRLTPGKRVLALLHLPECLVRRALSMRLQIAGDACTLIDRGAQYPRRNGAR